jgi:hypothetical protein
VSDPMVGRVWSLLDCGHYVPEPGATPDRYDEWCGRCQERSRVAHRASECPPTAVEGQGE